MTSKNDQRKSSFLTSKNDQREYYQSQVNMSLHNQFLIFAKTLILQVVLYILQFHYFHFVFIQILIYNQYILHILMFELQVQKLHVLLMSSILIELHYFILANHFYVKIHLLFLAQNFLLKYQE